MKRLLLPIIFLGLFFVGTVPAFHGSGLICSKCHTMHASEDGTLPTMPDDPSGTPEGPNAHLLYKANVTDLCLVCHDGQTGTPDVLGTDTNELTERAAGYLATVNTNNANGHNLGPNKIGSSSLCTTCHFGGAFDDAKIGCTDCHEPHGRDPGSTNYRYRNLQWASSPGGEPIITAHVNPSATGVNMYERANVGYTAPTVQSSSWREVTNICLDCHHTLSGYYYTRDGGTSAGHPIRHPTTDSERGAWEAINGHTGSTDPSHWETGTGIGFSVDRLPFLVSGAGDYAAATTVAQDNEVFCLTCHKAHGSTYNSSLRWGYRSDSNLGCQQCHNKGS